VQSQLRLCLDDLPKQDQDIPLGLQHILVKSTPGKSFPKLKKQILDAQQRCHKLFTRLVINN
jgi:hypothetical protein